MPGYMKTIINSALVLAILAALVYAFMPAPIRVDVAQVNRGTLLVTVDEDGRTRIKERYTVSAPLAGFMQRIALHPGDEVKPGSTLLTNILPNDPSLLDARALAEAEARRRAFQAALKQAQATQTRLKEAHVLTKNNYERAKKLFATQAVSVEAYEQAELLERMAQEELRAAEFRVTVAEFELEQATAALLRSRTSQQTDIYELYSPINGRILRVYQESAGPVTPGTRLVEVGDPTDLEVEVDVLSSDAVKIKPGARVFLERWGGTQTLTGRVRLVEPAGFLKLSALGVEEQRVYIIIDFDDLKKSDSALGDGYRVDARIVIWEGKDVLKVPTGALFRSQGEWAVFRVVNQRSQLTKLQLGRKNSAEAEVLGGLSEGDQVILHPSDRIQHEVKVRSRD
ncbi:MAG: HlyD family efflux transporter periplasmic adaptor subunit [Planctomycetia bacterium]|nr:HlyD family efflux transporter periplasmic adaptor subunit [Planctomycetia bacterium]